MEWKIEPSATKNVVEFIRYENEKGLYIVYATYYRWGEVFVNSDTKPYYEYNNFGTLFEECDNNLDHSYSSEIVEFSDGMSETTKNELIDFVEEHGISELEDTMGWQLIDTKIRIYGPLQINKV